MLGCDLAHLPSLTAMQSCERRAAGAQSGIKNNADDAFDRAEGCRRGRQRLCLAASPRRGLDQHHRRGRYVVDSGRVADPASRFRGYPGGCFACLYRRDARRVIGGPAMGWLSDRFGITVPVAIGTTMLALGLALASQAATMWQFTLVHGLLIGGGTSASFGPVIADISLCNRQPSVVRRLHSYYGRV